MSDLLYQNLYEHTRLIEKQVLTEEGLFIKDRTPDDFSGAVIEVDVVQRVFLLDRAGHMAIQHFNNPVPLHKDRTPCTGEIKDNKGNILFAGDQDATKVRTWVFQKSTVLAEWLLDLGDLTLSKMAEDGPDGTKT